MIAGRRKLEEEISLLLKEQEELALNYKHLLELEREEAIEWRDRTCSIVVAAKDKKVIALNAEARGYL